MNRMHLRQNPEREDHEAELWNHLPRRGEGGPPKQVLLYDYELLHPYQAAQTLPRISTKKWLKELRVV